MLEQMRKQGASIFVYLIFCLLIVIFVINFRPGQSRQGDNGCTGTSNVKLSVDGNDVSETAFKMAFSYYQGPTRGRINEAIETLIRREILAQAAEERGLRVTDDLAMEEIKKGWFFYRGRRDRIPGIFDEGGNWDLKAFNNWVGGRNVSRNSYIDEQTRSMAAEMMSNVLSESVQVSRNEALEHYIYENNTATYDVVTFKPETYRAAMKLTDADVDHFLASHEEDVKARYKADERTYKGVKPQLKLRQIFIAKREPKAEPTPEPSPQPKAENAGSAAKADDKKADDKKADDKKADDKKVDDKKVDDKKVDDKKADAKKPEAKPIGLPIEEAKAKLEAARTAIAANKQKFADAAHELSTDEAAKAMGGDLGWHTADNAMLTDKAVTDAVKALKPGEMTPVITTDRGAYLVIAEDKREGDLGFDQVKKDIAKQLAGETWSKEAAKRAALAALKSAQSSATNLGLYQLYEHEKAPSGPGLDLQKIMNDPNLSEEQKQELLQQFIQRSQSLQHGALEVETKDQPAGWFASDEPTGSAAKGSAAATPPAPAPATGSATAGLASGSAAAAGTPPATPPPATPASEAPTASKDELPQMAEVAKPQVSRFGPAPRAKQMSGLGQSKDAIGAVFDELVVDKDKGLAKRIYQTDQGYVVIQLVARNQANVAEFDKEADRRVAELRKSRGQAFVEEWLKERCEALAKDKKITPNLELITERDDQGKLLPISYHPCMSFNR